MSTEHCLAGTDDDPRWCGPEGEAVLEQIIGHPLPKNSEADIQDRLYIEFNRRGHTMVVPNVQMFGWESDLVSMTTAAYLCEYEIKISRADFRVDAKKIRHRILDGSLINERKRGPAFFYYVVPRDLIAPQDVPSYAGLIYSHPMMQIVKPAPKLHRDKATEYQQQWLFRSMNARYWRYRLRKGMQ